MKWRAERSTGARFRGLRLIFGTFCAKRALQRRAIRTFGVSGAYFGSRAHPLPLNGKSVTSAGENVTSPSPSAGYLGSIGTAGCKPAATFHISGGGASGFPEAGMDTGRGSIWAPFFNPVPPPANQEIKVVWRMTGAGDFTFQVLDTRGKTVPLLWGPEVHSSSEWNHPGDEVGTGLKFSHSGCWQIHVAKADVDADLWLEVVR
jgi:hypothetical protein